LDQRPGLLLTSDQASSSQQDKAPASQQAEVHSSLDRAQERLCHDVTIQRSDRVNSRFSFRVAYTNELKEEEQNEPGIHFIRGDVQVRIPLIVSQLDGTSYTYSRQITEVLNKYHPDSTITVTDLNAVFSYHKQ
jgi:hypothetical protein